MVGMGGRLTTYEHDGLRFDVRDRGPEDGRLVVALHGFPQTSASWEPVGRSARRGRLPGPRAGPAGLLARCPPACGVPRTPCRPWSATSWPWPTPPASERFDLLGHDWGGAVAWAVAAAHPDRVRTLTVASTPHPAAMVAALPARAGAAQLVHGRVPAPGAPGAAPRAAPRSGRRLLAAMATPRPRRGAGLPVRPRPPRAGRSPGTARPSAAGSAGAASRWASCGCRRRTCGATGTRRWGGGPPSTRRSGWTPTTASSCCAGVSHWIPDERPDALAELVLERLATDVAGRALRFLV